MPRNKLAKLASKLDCNTGQHHLPAPLTSTITTTGQQQWPAALVSTTGRHHWPGRLATCSKHVDDDDDKDDDDNDNGHDYDDDADDDNGNDGDGDGDGDHELTVPSNMCLHDCARSAVDFASWPAKWTATLGSTANTIDQH